MTDESPEILVATGTRPEVIRLGSESERGSRGIQARLVPHVSSTQ